MRRRPRLSPTIDRFLTWQFLGPFLFSLAAFSGIYLLVDIFDRFDDLLRYGGFGRLGVEYFLLKLPLIVSQLLPMAGLAGALLCFALLNRTGEVLAFQGLGVSRLELAAPIVMIAVIISVFDFVLSEAVVPVATREAARLYTVELKKRHPMGVFANRDIWIRVQGGFLTVDRYDSTSKKLFGITVYHLGPKFTLHDIHLASAASWDGREWQLSSMQVLEVHPNGSVSVAPDDGFHLYAKPSDFGLVRRDPDQFSLGELNRYIHGLRRRGLDPGGYVVDRDLKYATPLACLIMVALGTSLSLDPRPRNLGLGRSFGIGLALGFGYWVALGFTASFGRSGALPAWLAAWLPNATFAGLAAASFLLGEER